MQRRHIFLTKIQIESLNKISKRREIKTSELIRRIVDKFIEDEMMNKLEFMDKVGSSYNSKIEEIKNEHF